MEVLVIGDLAIDFFVRVDGAVAPGSNILVDVGDSRVAGVAGNISWYLAQLGAKAGVAGCVGRDSWGRQIIRELEGSGVDATCVTFSKKATGFFVVLVDAKGDRAFIGSRGANADLRISRRRMLGTGARWIHLSGYSLLGATGVMDEARRAAGSAGVPLSVDLEGVCSTGARLDLSGCFVFCNRREFEEYYGGPRGLSGERAVVVKSGEEGCVIYRGEGRTRVATLPQQAVDTTAAGDAFNAGLISSMLRGRGLLRSCRWANAVAGAKVLRTGARARLDLEEVRSLYAKM